jgi:hypothetical protein
MKEKVEEKFFRHQNDSQLPCFKFGADHSVDLGLLYRRFRVRQDDGDEFLMANAQKGEAPSFFKTEKDKNRIFDSGLMSDDESFD